MVFIKFFCQGIGHGNQLPGLWPDEPDQFIFLSGILSAYPAIMFDPIKLTEIFSDQCAFRAPKAQEAEDIVFFFYLPQSLPYMHPLQLTVKSPGDAEVDDLIPIPAVGGRGGGVLKRKDDDADGRESIV